MVSETKSIITGPPSLVLSKSFREHLEKMGRQLKTMSGIVNAMSIYGYLRTEDMKLMTTSLSTLEAQASELPNFSNSGGSRGSSPSRAKRTQPASRNPLTKES